MSAQAIIYHRFLKHDASGTDYPTKMTTAMLSSLLELLRKGNSSAECFPSMQFTTLSVVLLSGADLRGLLITLLSLRIFEKKKGCKHNLTQFL